MSYLQHIDMRERVERQLAELKEALSELRVYRNNHERMLVDEPHGYVSSFVLQALKEGIEKLEAEEMHLKMYLFYFEQGQDTPDLDLNEQEATDE